MEEQFINDKIEKQCVTMCHNDRVRKQQLGVTWRLIIRHGLKHLEECIPKAEYIQNAYDKATRSSEYAKLLYRLRNEYPKVYEALTTTRKSETDGSTFR